MSHRRASSIQESTRDETPKMSPKFRLRSVCELSWRIREFSHGDFKYSSCALKPVRNTEGELVSCLEVQPGSNIPYGLRYPEVDRELR